MNRTRNRTEHARLMALPGMRELNQLYGHTDPAAEYAIDAMNDSVRQCAPDDDEDCSDLG